MANTYESKFKGVEIDDGVNIATYATGTGGINVTIKGTTNVTGTGGRHLEIDGSGKQDKITDQTSLNARALSANSLNIGGSGAVINGALTVTGYSSLNGIFVDNSTTKPICFKRNGSIVTKVYGPTSGGGELVNVYLPGKGGTLALTSDIPTGGGGTTYTAGKNIVIDCTTIAMADSLTGINSINITGGQYGKASIDVGGTDDSPIESSGPYTFCAARYTEMFGTYKPTRYALVFPGGTGATIADNYFSAYFPTGNGTLTTETSFKTLFGNQSLVGEGNIDLYKHHLTLSMGSYKFYIDFVSSNNLNVNSLTNLQTILGNTFQIACYGFFDSAETRYYAQYADENGIYYANSTNSFSWSDFTITDTVTTI